MSKKHIIFILLVCIIGISVLSSVSASDLNETIASEIDENEISIEQIEENHEDKLSQIETNEIIAVNYTPKTSSEIQSFVDSAKAGDTIVLDGYYLLNRTISVNKQLNFIGINGATVDGNESVRLFSVSNGVTFKNITFKNGYSELNSFMIIGTHLVGSGSAIDGKCIAYNCSFVNNRAEGFYSHGGALYEGYAENCIFINNSAVGEGGAISYGDAVNCIFTGNSIGYSLGTGGAIYRGSAVNCTFRGNSKNVLADSSAVNCSFIDNSNRAISGGSAVNCTFINNSGGAMSGSNVINCIFIDNSAEKGGAMYSGSAVNCTFINNSASSFGGAVCYGSVVNCTFINNSASSSGGAVYSASVVNCSFSGNSAVDYGGAVSCDSYDSKKYAVTNSTFEKNHAKNGGAIHLVEVINCNFTDNYANYNGGAIYNSIVLNSTFERNSATNNGGAIWGDNDEILNCTFIDNTAKNGGATSKIVALNCNFTNNHATENGGAMYDGFALNCTFNKNHADNNGGAISEIIVANSKFEYNTADNNGGAMDGGRANNCVFNNNHAKYYGGAVYNAEVSSNSQFQDNTASEENNGYNVTYFEIGNTFTDLEKLFDNNLSEIYITNNYTFEFGLDYYLKNGIVINHNVTVYGNGFTLDGIKFSRIFSVKESNVVFKDLIFINGYAESGAAISGNCIVEKCSFLNNSGRVLNDDCSAINCTFIGNSKGAMYRGSAINCTFINNSGDVLIGDYYYYSGVIPIYAINCWFENNSGSAIRYGNAVNCTFIGNSGVSGSAIYEGSAEKCTFINNSATDLGGAVCGIAAVNCIFINNSNTYSGYYSDHGGGAMNRGYAVNCTFINNKGNRYGGAMSCVGNVENCIFINNSAAYYGGAINCWNNVKNCTFINNSAGYGGAIYFDSGTVTVLNSTFINNGVDGNDVSSSLINCTIRNTKYSIKAKNAINCRFINNSNYFSGNADNCIFINNTGGAMRYGNAYNCTFINNSAENGGAMSYNSAVNCIFINNSATDEGGAVYKVVKIVNCTFIHNSAQKGGAINGGYGGGPPYYGIYLASIENCTFINNSAEYGGAINGAESVVNCTFINNSATFGGSINGLYDLYYYYYIYIGPDYHYVGTFYTNVYNCTFINGSAKYGGAMFDGNAVNCSFVNNSADYGGGIYINSNMNVTYCNFTNCFANFEGGAIYINQSGNVSHCNFIRCSSSDDNCLAANSSSKYNIMECIFDKYPTNIEYHYASSLISHNLTYFNGEEGILTADLSDMRGSLNNQIVYIIINGKKYNVTTDSKGCAHFNIPDYLNEEGIYNATLIFEGDNIINPSSFNLTVTINRHIAILNASDLVLFKNEYGTVIANLSNIRGPLSGKEIIFTINKITRTIPTDENGLAEFNVLNYISNKGEYTVNITFAGDDFNHPISKNIDFIYVDYKGILTCSVDGKYYNDTILSLNLVNYRNNKPINGETIKLIFSNDEIVYLTTDVDGNAYYRIPFNPDYYNIVACIDSEFVSVNNVSIKNIEINKVFGVIEHSLLNGNKTLKFKLSNRYNGDALRNIQLNLIFNNGEKAEIISDDKGIATYDIPFPKGVYSVSVTVIGDYKDFEPDPDYISNIIVSNDLNCSINFTNNITFDFGEYGSTNFTVEGGIIGNVSVIDHPEAKISVTNNEITVFGLGVGKYILLVETNPDDYHNPVNATLNITVNTVKSKVTFSTGVAFEYGGSATIHVTVDGGSVNGKTIQVVGHPEAKISFTKDMITVSNLNPGTYTLRVESIPDSDHKIGEGTVGITVKKSIAVIKASKLIVALKSGALWTIKLVDSKYGKPISNMKITLKVYTGKKYKTVTLTTNSKGEAYYKTSSLTKGNHKVVVSATHEGYNFNTLTSSISVIKPTKLSFKVKKNIAKDGSSLSITVMKGKKPINGVDIKLLVYTGKKYKTIILKSKNKGKYNGVCGWGTNKISAGNHKVVIIPSHIKYSGSKTVKMKLKKSAKKYPNWETKI